MGYNAPKNGFFPCVVEPDYKHMKDAKEILNGFKKDFTGKSARQISVLYSTQVVAIVLGILTRMIVTRSLEPADYGVFAFFITITTFTILFFRLGVFSAGQLLIAETQDDNRQRELAGTLVLAAFIIGAGYALFIFGASFLIDPIFDTEVGWILRASSVLLVGLPLQYVAHSVGTGMNRIERMSLMHVFPRGLFLLGALLLLRVFEMKAQHFIYLHVASIFVGMWIVTALYRPKYSNLKGNLAAVIRKTREYGMHVYQGEIASLTTYHLDGIFITYFVNTTQLGFYNLAMVITTPIHNLSRSLAISFFRRFTSYERVPRKIMIYNILWLTACVVGLALFGRFIISLLFTEKYLPAAKFLLPLSIAAFFQGLYQPYAFLAAKGKGKWIRNVAQAEAVSNIIGNVVLIYFYGAMGAAIASAISKFLHWVLLRRYYHRFLRESGEE